MTAFPSPEATGVGGITTLGMLLPGMCWRARRWWPVYCGGGPGDCRPKDHRSWVWEPLTGPNNRNAEIPILVGTPAIEWVPFHFHCQILQRIHSSIDLENIPLKSVWCFLALKLLHILLLISQLSTWIFWYCVCVSACVRFLNDACFDMLYTMGGQFYPESSGVSEGIAMKNQIVRRVLTPGFEQLT